METLIRLQKLISQFGYTSRRKAEILIKEGKVRINGVIQRELGIKIPKTSLIEIEGKIINRPIQKIYLLINKPPGYICSRRDPFGRSLIYDLIDKKYKKHGLFLVGRLDYMSEGLLLLTNDGFFANKIMHPSSGIIKKYEVLTAKNIPYKSIDDWKNGVYIKGVKYKIVDITRVSSVIAVISLIEGKNREIRKLFEHIGLPLKKLKRIAIGPIEMGDLPIGGCRELLKNEIQKLFQIANT